MCDPAIADAVHELKYAPFFFFLITLGLEVSDTAKSTSLEYAPSSERLLVTAKRLFLNRVLLGGEVGEEIGQVVLAVCGRRGVSSVEKAAQLMQLLAPALGR